MTKGRLMNLMLQKLSLGILAFGLYLGMDGSMNVRAVQYGLLAGMGVGVARIFHFTRNTDGNFYRRTPSEAWKVVGIMLSVTAVAIAADRADIGPASRVLSPVFVALPVAALPSMVWLMVYERRHGIVSIHPPS